LEEAIQNALLGESVEKLRTNQANDISTDHANFKQDITTLVSTLAKTTENLHKRVESLQQTQPNAINMAEQVPPKMFHSQAPSRPFCQICKRNGHKSQNCWYKHNPGPNFRTNQRTRQFQPSNPGVICWTCNKPGHIQRNCFQNNSRQFNSFQSHVGRGQNHIQGPSFRPQSLNYGTSHSASYQNRYQPMANSLQNEQNGIPQRSLPQDMSQFNHNEQPYLNC